MLKVETPELWFILNLPEQRNRIKITGLNGTDIYKVVQAKHPTLPTMPFCLHFCPGQWPKALVEQNDKPYIPYIAEENKQKGSFLLRCL